MVSGFPVVSGSDCFLIPGVFANYICYLLSNAAVRQEEIAAGGNFVVHCSAGFGSAQINTIPQPGLS
jgi:hypothetical protein